MDAAGLGDRLPEGTQKPLLRIGSPSLQCWHWESSKVLAGLAFCEMQTQYPRSAFQGLCGGHQRWSAAVCDPNPPCPFARYRLKINYPLEWSLGYVFAQQLPAATAQGLVLCQHLLLHLHGGKASLSPQKGISHFASSSIRRAFVKDLLMGLFRGASFPPWRGCPKTAH